MLDIDTAIKHCLEVANSKEMEAEFETDYECYFMTDKERKACKECAADHRQLAEWLTELKEAKRLLKAAVDDFRWLESHTEDRKGHCCISGDNKELACIHCPLNQRNKDTIMCGWNYEAEALALIGDEPNGI